MLDNNNHAQAEAFNSAKLLDIQAVATLLSVSQRTVQRLTKAGRIRALKLSSKILRYSKADILSYLEGVGSFCIQKPRRSARQ